MAVTMAIVCWKLFLEEHKKKLSVYPLINLITREIISHKVDVDDYSIGAAEWNRKIYEKMYKSKSPYLDQKINGLEFMLPYRFLPLVFFVFWVVLIVALCYIKGLEIC